MMHGFKGHKRLLSCYGEDEIFKLWCLLYDYNFDLRSYGQLLSLFEEDLEILNRKSPYILNVTFSINLIITDHYMTFHDL